MLQQWKLILTNWVNCYNDDVNESKQSLNIKWLLNIITHLRENLNLDESKSSTLEAHTVQEFLCEKYPAFKFENGTVEAKNEEDVCLAASLLLYFVCVNSKNFDIKHAMCSKLSAEDQEIILKFSKCLMDCAEITRREVEAAITEACGQNTAAMDISQRFTVAETPPALRSLHGEVRRLQAALDAEKFDRNYLQDELSRTQGKLEQLLKEKDQHKLDILNLKAKISLCCGEHGNAKNSNHNDDKTAKLTKQLEQLEDRLEETHIQLNNITYERDAYKTKLDELKHDRDKWYATSQQESARVAQLSDELDTERRQSQSLKDLVAELSQHNKLNTLDTSSLECDDPDASIRSLPHNSSICSELCANVVEVQLGEERAKIVILKQQIQTLQDQINELNVKAETEKKTLETVVSQRENDIFNLKHRINEEIEEKHTIKAHCESEITKLNNELNELEQKYKHHIAQSSSLAEKRMQEIQTLQEEKQSLLHSLNNETTKLENIIKELKLQIDTERQSRSAMKEGFENHIMKLNEKVLNRNNELVELQNTIFEKGEMIETLQIKLKEETEIVAKLNNEYDVLRELKQSVDTELRQKCNDINSLNVEIQQNNAVIKDKTSKIEELEALVASSNENMKTLEKANDEMCSEIKNKEIKIHEVFEKLQQMIEIFNIEKDKLLQDIDEKNATISSLQTQLQNEISFKVGLQNELSQAQNAYTTLKEEFNRVNLEISNLYSQIKDKQSTIDAMGLEIQKERELKDTAIKNIEALSDELNTKNNYIKTLDVRFENVTKSLQDDIQKSKEENEVLQDKLQTVIAEKETLNLEIKNNLNAIMNEKALVEKDLTVKGQELLMLQAEYEQSTQKVNDTELRLKQLTEKFEQENQSKDMILLQNELLITELKNEMEKLKYLCEKKIEDFTKGKERYTQHIISLETEHKELQVTIEKDKSIITSMKALQENLEQENQSKGEMLMKNESQIIELINQIGELKTFCDKQIEDFRKEKERYVQKITALEEETKELQSTIEKDNTVIASIKALQENLNQENESKDEILMKNECQIKALTCQLDELKTLCDKQIGDFGNEAERYTQKIISLEGENKELQFAIEKSDTLITSMKALQESLNQENQSKDEIMTKNELQIIELTNQVGEWKTFCDKQIEDFSKEKEIYIQKITSLEGANKELQSTIEKDYTIIKALQENLNQENESKEEILMKNELQIKALTCQVDDLKTSCDKQIKDFGKETEIYKQKITALEGENQELLFAIKRETAIIASMKALQDNLEQENQAKGDKLIRNKLQIKELDVEVDKLKTRCDKQKEKFAKESEMNITKIDTLEKQNKNLLISIQEINNNHEILLSDKDKTIDVLEQQLKENTLKHEQLSKYAEELQILLRNRETENKLSLQTKDDKIAQLDEIALSLKHKVSDIEQEKFELMKENKTLQVEKQSLLNSLKDETIKQEDIIKDLQLVIDTNKQIQSTMKEDYENHIIKLKEESLSINNELIELKNSVSEKDEKIEMLQIKLKSETEATETLQNECMHLNAQKKTIEADLHIKIDEVSSLNMKLQHNNTVIEDMKSEIDQLKTSASSLHENIKILEGTKEKMFDEIKKRDMNIEEVLKNMHMSDLCKKEKNKLLQEIGEKNDSISSLQTKLQNEVATNEVLRKELMEGHNSHTILKEEFDRVSSKLSKLNVDIEEKEKAVCEMALVIQEEKKLKDTLNENIQVLSAEVSLKNDDIKTLNEKLENVSLSLQHEIDRTKQDLEVARNLFSLELAEKERLNLELVSLKNEKALIEDNLALHIEQLATLRLKCEETLEKLNETESKLNSTEFHGKELEVKLEQEIQSKAQILSQKEIETKELETKIAESITLCDKLNEYFNKKIYLNIEKLCLLLRKVAQLELTVKENNNIHRNALNDKDNVIETLKEELKEYILKYEMLNQSTQELKMSSESVQNEITRALQEKQERISQYDAAMLNLKLVISEMEHENGRIKETLEAKNTELENSLQILEGNLQSLEQANESLLNLLRLERQGKANVERESEEIREYLDEVITHLNKERNTNTSVISALEYQERTMVGDYERVKTELETVRKDYEELKQSKDDVANQLQKQIDILSNVCQEQLRVESTLQEKEHNLSELKQTVNELMIKIDVINKEKEELKNENSKFLANIEELKAKTIRVENEEIAKLKTENRELLAVIDDKKSAISKLEQLIEQELEENRKIRHENAQEKILMTKKYTQLEDEIAKKMEEHEKDLTALRNEIDKLQSKIEYNEQELNNRDELISKISIEKDTIISAISKELAEEKSEREKYEKDFETQQLADDEMKYIEIQALRKENEQLIRAVAQKKTFEALYQENAANKYSDHLELRNPQVDSTSTDITQTSLDTQKTITDLEKIILDKNRTVTNLQSDITYLKTVLANSEMKALDVSRELEVTKENCEQLSSQLKKIVHQKNEEIADLKKQVMKMSATENRATQIIKVSAKYQAMILKRIAEIKSNTVLKELTNFGNTNENDVRRSLAGTVTMEDLENFLETTDRHIKRCAEKQISLQKERDRLSEVNKINESEIINLKKFLTELSVSFQTFNTLKDIYGQKLSRVISIQRTVRREILSLDGRITDATMCKLERGYGAAMQDLSECTMNMERWVERCITRTVSVEKIKQAFTSDSELMSLSSNSFKNTSLEIQLDELEKGFQKLLEEVARSVKGDGAKDEQATTLMEVRAEYEDKLNRMKAKMKDLFNEQMGVLKNKQRNEIEILERELQKTRAQFEKEKQEYEIHIQRLTKEVMNVAEKYMMTKHDEAKLKKIQKSGSLMSLQHVHSSGLAPLEAPPRASDAHSLRSLPAHDTHSKREGRGLHMSDEEGELFDNRYLKELSTPRRDPRDPRRDPRDPGADPRDPRRLSELQWRNSLCPPHLKSSYPAETQFTNALHEDDIKHSLGGAGRGQRKEVGITAYKKPGPPTPSKQAGRLSATDSELRESLRVEGDPGHDRKTSTPGRFMAFLGRTKNHTNESTPRPRRLSNIFRKNKS